jgi:tRNA (guanine37-N1)-methyltransferase
MKFTVITLFPNLIQNFLSEGLLGQAVSRGALEIATLNPREFTSDVHHTVDDRAFGGSDGMVMKVEPLLASIKKLRQNGECHVVMLTPQGRPWTQKLVNEYSLLGNKRVVLVCGRYAGIDQRVSAFADDEISLGDFILNGGEIAACAVIESVARTVPGVLGNSVSVEHDSFSDGLLESPQFTRPREIEGMRVPAPLLSGHHEQIKKFERAVSLIRTALKRPELLPEDISLDQEVALLESLEDSELKSLGVKRPELTALRDL